MTEQNVPLTPREAKDMRDEAQAEADRRKAAEMAVSERSAVEEHEVRLATLEAELEEARATTEAAQVRVQSVKANLHDALDHEGRLTESVVNLRRQIIGEKAHAAELERMAANGES